MNPFTVEISNFNLLESLDTWPSTWPLTKGFKSEHNPKACSGVKFSRLCLNQKIVFSIKNRSSNLTIFLQDRWSSFRISSCYSNHFLEPLKGSLTFLYMRSGSSCLNGKMCSNSMFRLVMNYPWTRPNISSSGSISILLERMCLKPVSESV